MNNFFDTALTADLLGRDFVQQAVLAAALLAEIWGVPVAETPVPIDLMVAFTHAGGCVLGAWVDDALIGVTVGFAGAPGSDRIYSYIAGVTRGFAGAGVGRHRHQRRLPARARARFPFCGGRDGGAAAVASSAR